MPPPEFSEVELEDDPLSAKAQANKVKDPWWLDAESWMNRNSKIAWVLTVALSITCVALLGMVIHFANKSAETGSASSAPATPATPKNVIFMLSDGFGPASVAMARVFKSQNQLDNGAAGDRYRYMAPLNLDTIHAGHARTYSSSSFVTDSAAGATAYSCGKKTINLQVGTDHQGQACATLMEGAQRRGMKTGIAVTSSLTDASPASFSSHSLYRNCDEAIAAQQATMGIDVMLGGGKKFYDPQNLAEQMQGHGYNYCNNKTCMDAASTTPVLGLFGEHHMDWDIDRDPAVQPSIKEMSLKAVELLDGSAQGFFLFIEGSLIDKAAHPNDLAGHLRDILAYDEAVGAMIEYARKDGNTLVISTSDHETGGVTLGRGTMYNPKGSAAGTEAPLRTESFLNDTEAEFAYEYFWKPEILNDVTKSAYWIAKTAIANIAGDWDDVRDSSTVRSNLVAEVASLFAEHAGMTMLEDEKELVWRAASSVQKSQGNRQYAVHKAIGSCVSRRAHVGWTTWGHTGVDVNFYSFGPGSNVLQGDLENSQIGNIIAELIGVDLEEETRVQQPKLRQIDLSKTVKSCCDGGKTLPQCV